MTFRDYLEEIDLSNRMFAAAQNAIEAGIRKFALENGEEVDHGLEWGIDVSTGNIVFKYFNSGDFQMEGEIEGDREV